MWFLYVVGIIIALIINAVIAKKFVEIADMKGHNGSDYFWYIFLFGIIGMLMVIALPDISEKETPNPAIIKPNPSTIKPNASPIVYPASTANAGEWKCTCGKIHKNYEMSCVCGVTKAEAKMKNNQNN